MLSLECRQAEPDTCLEMRSSDHALLLGLVTLKGDGVTFAEHNIKDSTNHHRARRQFRVIN